MNNETKQHAPATQRNREVILEVILEVLPPQGTILEVASGTGEHAVFFAPSLKPRRWLPSDPSSSARASIAAWMEDSGCDNLESPVEIDASMQTWLVETDFKPTIPITAIVNINMIHISPWSACLGLMAGANRILPAGGILYMYGPYLVNGQHTAPSNEAFDASLRSRDSEWGIRDLDRVVAAAKAENLKLLKTVQMPANNLSVIFEKV
jgi:Protein of unknown function (DUF938)